MSQFVGRLSIEFCTKHLLQLEELQSEFRKKKVQCE